MQRSKTIRDAVHGDMQFHEHHLAVMDTPTVQRLRGLKQLGTSSLVYPSAVHTRFDHSLGTCWMARRLLDRVERTTSIPESARQVILLSALLHDITHVPFGHTFEDERRLFARHDQDADRLDRLLDKPSLAEALGRTGVSAEVRGVLSGQSSLPRYVRQMVAGTVCADLLDYLRRDAYFCGFGLDYDDRLLDYFAIADDQLVFRLHKRGQFRRDALSELIHLLQMRYALTERVYYHHAKVVAGAMVSRALELALEANVFAASELLDLRDDSFLFRLGQGPPTERGIHDLLEDLAARQLYRCAYFVTLAGFGRPGISPAQQIALADQFHLDTARRRTFEHELASQLGVPDAHVILYCPSADMALKEADVPVEVEPGRVQPLSQLNHPDVSALTQKHRGLWRLLVLIRRGHAERIERAGGWCQERLGHPNQWEPLARGELAFDAGA